MSKGSKEARLVSMKFKSQLWEIISKYPPRLLNRSSRTAVGKDQRAYWPIKTGLREKQVLQDPGYVKGFETTCCMLHAVWYVARLYKISYVEGVERNKNSHNTVDLRHLSLMSKELKVHSIYNVDSNSKYSN